MTVRRQQQDPDRMTIRAKQTRPQRCPVDGVFVVFSNEWLEISLAAQCEYASPYQMKHGLRQSGAQVSPLLFP
jgi:hypothetical protein